MERDDWSGKRVVVMGLGRFGGGVGAARWLAERGADLLITDLASPESLAPALRPLDDLVRERRISLCIGEHRESDFTGADVVVANPAIAQPWRDPFLRAAAGAGAQITTEIGLLTRRLPDRRCVIGVTGTAGKSTTAAMIAVALSNATGRRAHLGGNIGGSLLPELERIAPDDWIVLELSSFMLYWLSGEALGAAKGPGWSPGVAVVTNFAPNHLDWHGAVEHYAACKRSILRPMDPSDLALAHESLAGWLDACGRERTRAVRAEEAINAPPLSIPGAHNRMNAAMALAVVESLGGHESAARSALASFSGLPHRLERVDVDAPVRVFNDSKSTTPQAAAMALAAFDEPGEVGAGRVHLLAGGYDKGVDLAPLVEAACRAARAWCVGATGPAIARAVNAAGGRATECGDLGTAVARALEAARPGDVLLLSPGCASWDQFRDFQERGRRFVQAVQWLTGPKLSEKEPNRP